jgi:uncharacterized membrane protein
MELLSAPDFVSVVRCLAAAGCGLMAGVFFAFSTFIMKALARLPAENGIAAMQSINAAAVTSWCLAVFLGTAAACALVVVSACARWSERSAMALLSGGALFLLGAFLVTLIFNVPMNNSLAALSVNSPDCAARWARYVADWTTWNHVRTIASLAAAVLLVAGWTMPGPKVHAIHSRGVDRTVELQKEISEACPERDSPFVVEMKRNEDSN